MGLKLGFITFFDVVLDKKHFHSYNTNRPKRSIGIGILLTTNKGYVMLDPRELIIKEAQGIFARFGFKKTTIDEIAKATNKAKSSIYHYFSSKEDIFKSILEEESRVLNQAIRQAINEVDSPAEKLRAYVIVRMYKLHEASNYYEALKDDYLKNYSFIANIRKDQDQKEIGFIKSILADGIEKGIFQGLNIDSTAEAMFIALKGFEFSTIMNKVPEEFEGDLSNLLSILFNGLLKR